MRVLAIAVAATFTVAASAAIAKGDPRSGAAKAKEVCAACHGLDGNSASPDFPKLAGQHEDYLAHSLSAYKDGRRKNPVMAPFAAPLSAKEINDLAAYFASQPTVLHAKPGGEQRAP
jgi:cytochrome c553